MDRTSPTRTDLDAVFREAVHVSRVPMVVTDPRLPDNPAVFVNDAFLRLTGFEPHEVLGHNLRLMQGPKTDPETVARIRRALASREALTVDILNYRRDGSAFWCALFISPVFNPQGVLTHYFASQLDVTDLKSDEAQRREQHERMQREIAESIPQLVWTADAEGRVTWRNRRWEDYTGIAVEELNAGRGRDVREPDEQAAFLSHWAKSVATGRPLEIVSRLRGRDGVARPFLCRATALKDGRGGVTGWFGTNTEITELSESEARFRLIAEALPQIVFAAGPDGLVDYYNSRWYQFTGTTPGETEGENWHPIIHPDDLARTIAAWNAAVATGELYEIEYRLRGADRQYRWFLGRCTPLRDSGTGAVLRWLGTCTDIEDAVQARQALARSRAELERLISARTAALEESNARLVAEAAERAKAEAALRQAQKMQAVGQLAGGVAHDFNNLLTVVLGGLDQLDRRLGSETVDPADLPRLRRAVAAAMHGATRAAALTQRLLGFSRQQNLDPQTVSANRLVDEMLDLLRRTLGERVQIETALAPSLWLTHADPNQLENALLNLAVNARDAMPDGGRLVISTGNATLTAAPEVAAGEYVMLAVRDTGTGMDAATLERCFDPFFTTKEAGHGTGLGLSQVFGFARQSYGHVEIDSAPGSGTTVKLYLPRASNAAAAAASPATAATPPVAPRASDEGTTVLVVEDDPDVRGFTTETLRELGYDVLETSAAAPALDILDRRPEIALLFADLVLPGGCNGRDLAAEAQRRRPGLKVLFTTGYGSHVAPPRAASNEAELLEKPFTYDVLATSLRRLLG